MSKLKLRCYECGEPHTNRAKNFPKQLVTMKSFPDPEDPTKKITRPVVVGRICKKCVRKIDLSQLKRTIKKEFKLGRGIEVTKHHIHDWFERQRIKGALKK